MLFYLLRPKEIDTSTHTTPKEYSTRNPVLHVQPSNPNANAPLTFIHFRDYFLRNTVPYKMGKKDTFVLYESSAGYSLFEVVQFEEIGALLEASQENVTDYARFCRSVKLKAFHPFENAEEALDNMNAVSEHSVSGLLQSFLEANMSKKVSLEGRPTQRKRKQHIANWRANCSEMNQGSIPDRSS